MTEPNPTDPGPWDRPDPGHLFYLTWLLVQTTLTTQARTALVLGGFVWGA
jgi:hypothetical protein